MALHDVVLEIAEDMEKVDWGRYPGCPIPEVAYCVENWVKQLRRAVKAAEGQQPQVNPITSLVLSASPEAASLQNATMIEQARAEFRKGKQKGGVQEQLEPRMVMTVGGPEDGTTVPCDPAMPVGARCLLDGETYELMVDGKLHHVGSSPPIKTRT